MKDLLVLPALGNSRQFPWLLVLREGGAHGPPQFFLTYGRNWSKFADREAEGFRIIGHIKSRADAVACCDWHNSQLPNRAARRRQGHQLSKLKKDVDLTRLGQPKEKKPMLILPKDFKKDNPQ